MGAVRYCMECKKYLDRIYSQAKNQSQMAWWRGARSDERQTREMLQQYRVMLGEAGNPKRIKINVAELRENVTRQQRQTVVNHGRMMWMREAIEFWQTTSGGALSLEAAEACSSSAHAQPPHVKQTQEEGQTMCSPHNLSLTSWGLGKTLDRSPRTWNLHL